MAYFIGIDLGGTRAKIGLADEEGIIAFRNIKSFKDNCLATNIRSIEKTVFDICQGTGLSISEIESIGFSFPGLVNNKQNRVIATNGKFSDAITFQWDHWAYQTYGAPLYLDNDARMAAIGEWKQGVATHFSDFVLVTLGTGIGTAVIMDNRPMVGKHFQAGNLGGHFIIDRNGIECTCGNKGCVEAEASSISLERLARRHPQIRESALGKRTNIDFHLLFRLAEKDSVAKEIRDYCMDTWSAAIINYIHAYDPEAVVISGGIMNSKHVVLPYIQKKVNERAWSPSGNIKILSSELHDMAGVNGALYMAKKKIEKNERKKTQLR